MNGQTKNCAKDLIGPSINIDLNSKIIDAPWNLNNSYDDRIEKRRMEVENAGDERN